MPNQVGHDEELMSNQVGHDEELMSDQIEHDGKFWTVKMRTMDYSVKSDCK
jgi:hypothetical protein